MRRLRKPSWPFPVDVRKMLPTADRFDSSGRAAQSDVGASGQVAERGDEVKHQVVVEFQMRTVSTSNIREHWGARARRVKAERQAAYWQMRSMAKRIIALPATIVLTRVAAPAGKILDDDNLRGCMKAVRDGVADWLGIQDNDKRVTWQYAQRKGKEWLVQIEVR